MSGPIALTSYEIDELKHEIAVRTPGSPLDAIVILHAVINGLNKLRAPQPIGTVRADDDGNIAVKTNMHASDQWFVHRLRDARCNAFESDHYVKDWPIVYKPPGEQ